MWGDYVSKKIRPPAPSDIIPLTLARAQNCDGSPRPRKYILIPFHFVAVGVFLYGWSTRTDNSLK